MDPLFQAYCRDLPEEKAQLVADLDTFLEKKLGDLPFHRSLAYGMPTYKNKKNFFHFAPQAKHLGIYPTPAMIQAFQDQLVPYKQSKGAFQIPYNQEIPWDLLGKMILKSYHYYHKEELT